jgi:hypothetical protein
MSSLVGEVELLYETVVMDPAGWNDQMLVDWADGIAATTDLDRELSKHLRRIARVAEKLQRFWIGDPRCADQSPDWRSRVDLSLGVRAWRPLLDMAMYQLECRPSSEHFDDVASLFRVVHGTEWLDGMTFDDWLGEFGRN